MMLNFLADKPVTFWFPEQASTFAAKIDFLYWAILWISLVFFIPIVIAMIMFMIKYRQRPGYKGDPHALHNTPLEITWTVVPTFIVVWIFWEGASGYLDMMRVPDNAHKISVYGQKWLWSFKYENGGESNDLHVPVGTDIKMVMESKDVLHSFYIPSFRVKRDVVPGRKTFLWFHAIKEGKYDLFCTEYCGDNHSTMKAKVIVESPEKYEKFLIEANKEPEDIVERGKWLYERNACKGCHYAGNQGTSGPGPSYNGTWGKPVPLAKGGEVKFDEEYVRTSIMDPSAAARKGYEGAAAMPSYKGRLKAEQVDAIIEFIKSLESVPPPAK